MLDASKMLEIDNGLIETGRVTLQGLKSVPAEQAWFWAETWQAGEREASEQLARGEGSLSDDSAAFLDGLR